MRASLPSRMPSGTHTSPHSHVDPFTLADCEHPHDSPQWRKGPPQHPVLCNACGTRWLRNGTLKPLVPRRGLRYKNKPKPAAKGKAAAAAAAAAAANAAAAVLGAAPPLAMPPPIPAPVQHKQLAAVPGLAQPAHSSDLSGELTAGSDGCLAACLAGLCLSAARVEVLKGTAWGSICQPPHCTP
jgi:hypothetical protein